jgi:hypothetical protein
LNYKSINDFARNWPCFRCVFEGMAIPAKVAESCTTRPASDGMKD